MRIRYGIPFLLGWGGFKVSIRKDIDKGFSFPKGVILKKKLKEILEDEVNEKYYIDSLKSLSLIDPFNGGYELEGIQLKRYLIYLKKFIKVMKVNAVYIP